MNRYKSPISVTHPELAAEAVGWDASTLSSGSNKKMGWKCKNGHTWLAQVANRSAGRGCPVCIGRRVLIGFNDLATTHPEIAAQAFEWDPTTLSVGANKKVGWKCEKNHTWSSRISDKIRAQGCPVCIGRRVLIGFNDLATINPEIAAQAFEWDPTTLTAYSGKKVYWRCERGHNWKVSVSHRSNGSGCPYCSGLRITAGENDLATINPKLAAEAFEWDPTTLSQFSSKKVSWKCKRGHTWQDSVSHRSTGNGCPICSNHQVLVGYNDLATTHSAIASQAFDWDPTTLTAGSSKKVVWKCEQGHSWKTTVTKRSNGSGCPICANQIILVGYNDLMTTHPELAAQADDWDATTLTAGSNQKRKWRCSEGHSWSAVISSRLKGPNGGSGCPSCTKYGFNPSLPGWLYFLEHDGWDLYQIGITNDPNRRIGKHSSSGWTSIEIRGPMDGTLARSFETSILRSLKIRGAMMANKADIRRFDGWTEAWTKDSLSVTSFKQLLDWVYQDDEKKLMTKAL